MGKGDVSEAFKNDPESFEKTVKSLYRQGDISEKRKDQLLDRGQVKDF